MGENNGLQPREGEKREREGRAAAGEKHANHKKGGCGLDEGEGENSTGQNFSL